MFITLRTSGSGSQKEQPRAMEQIARRNAAPGRVNDRVRAIRRVACLSCQAKKLRCSGGTTECDRCRARSIECIFPPSNAGQDKSRVQSATPSPPNISWQDQGANLESQSGGPTLTTSVSQPSLTAPGLDEVPSNFFDLEIDGLDIPLGSSADFLSTVPSDGHDTPAQDGPSSFFSNNILGQSEPPTQQPRPRNIGPLTPAHTPFSFPQGNPTPQQDAPCSCLNDLLRVVQQLDDDEFRMTTLSMDQVLQLQKWMVFQCYKPLDCPGCVDLATVSTVTLSICDRLTEMFECTYRRLEAVRAKLNGEDPAASLPWTPQWFVDGAIEGPAPAQLFCGVSGGPANRAKCNAAMFSEDFRNQYSDEEQVEMIRVLLRLQLRNYRQLLTRLQATRHVKASQARESKVKAMLERLERAATSINEAWVNILDAFSAG